MSELHDCSRCSVGKCIRHPSVMKVAGEIQICSGDRGAIIQKRYMDSWDRQEYGESVPLRLAPFAVPVKSDANGGAVSGGCCGKTKTVAEKPVPTKGPGTELTAIFASMGITENAGCNCKLIADEMNRDGSAGVRSKREYYADLLAESAKQATTLQWARVIAAGYLSCGALVDESVRRAEAPAFVKERIANRPPLIGVPIDRRKIVSHIIYHVMPVAGPTEWVWRRHLQWLTEVRHKFNGRLIIGIVTEGKKDHWKYMPPEAVREATAGLDAEYVESPNHVGRKSRTGLGEGALYPLLLGRLETNNPNEIAYYGHCKGVTREDVPTAPSHIWAEAMFDTLFRNQASVEKALDTYGVCGPLRMRGGRHQPVGSPGVGPHWFFSGTFFAMRLVDVFRRNWKQLPPHYGNVEQWPRLNFDMDSETACVFLDDVQNLYDETYWLKTVTPALRHWRLMNGAR
jgi:hypothetical protein